MTYEYLNLLLLLDATGAYFGLRDLNANRASLLRITAAVGDVDAAISVASYREGWRLDAAGFLSRGSADLTDLRHPLLADAVPNSITLRPGAGVLVTGSNMSGKSTFLEDGRVNAILAQTVNTCAIPLLRRSEGHRKGCWLARPRRPRNWIRQRSS